MASSAGSESDPSEEVIGNEKERRTMENKEMLEALNRTKAEKVFTLEHLDYGNQSNVNSINCS